LNETVVRRGRGGNISSDVNFAGRKRDEKKINGFYTNRTEDCTREIEKIERQTSYSCL
jgi:hypothetical protein